MITFKHVFTAVAVGAALVSTYRLYKQVTSDFERRVKPGTPVDKTYAAIKHAIRREEFHIRLTEQGTRSHARRHTVSNEMSWHRRGNSTAVPVDAQSLLLPETPELDLRGLDRPGHVPVLFPKISVSLDTDMPRVQAEHADVTRMQEFVDLQLPGSTRVNRIPTFIAALGELSNNPNAPEFRNFHKPVHRDTTAPDFAYMCDFQGRWGVIFYEGRSKELTFCQEVNNSSRIIGLHNGEPFDIETEMPDLLQPYNRDQANGWHGELESPAYLVNVIVQRWRRTGSLRPT